MATHESAEFLAGVIEGFYGPPWTQAERFELFDWMQRWGLNTYCYAPKDDLKHRALWRELYTASEAEIIAQSIQACRLRHLRFIYAISPGLDIRYGSEADLDRLRKRFEQMLALGCQDFSLLFDDIPDHMDPEDLKRHGSLASAQCHVANEIFRWIRESRPQARRLQARRLQARFLFCPTAYCGRMAARKLGGEGYLSTLGRELRPEIEVLWTGPEIISREITVADVQELQAVLRRKPVIWDNLHANDYDGRRFFCGPYAGRPLELRGAVSGLLCNPNTEFPLNYVPLRTLAGFVHCQATWDSREAYLSAMREWLPRFATVGPSIPLEDLVLFGDCYYLPHEEGPEAEALYHLARGLLATVGARTPATHRSAEPPLGAESLSFNAPSRGSALPPPLNPFTTVSVDPATAFRQRATRLRDSCLRMTELRERPLFHALSRRLWALREEIDLLMAYVEFKAVNGDAAFRSDFHLPGTYRGGMVTRLERLLVQQPDGTFTP